MTRAVSLKLAAANQVPVQFSREASKLSRFVIPFQPDWDRSLGAQNQSRYDLDLRKHVSLSSDEICFAAKITYALEPLFRSYRIWRYLWFNYWTEARQNGIYRLNLRSPNMVDSMMQFLSQKVWHGPLPFLRTQRRISLVCWSPTTATSVSAHVETEVAVVGDQQTSDIRLCVRRNGSGPNHRSQSRDEWSPYCSRDSTLTSCAHTQLAIFGNKIFGMVTSIPGSFLLWNF